MPLSDAALAVLEKQQAIRTNEFVFAAARGIGHATQNTPAAVLKRLGRDALTAHGFHSTFSDWCAEQTDFDPQIKEMALAHAIGKVEGTYTGTLVIKRRAPDRGWAAYCDGQDNVVTLRASA